MIASARRRWYSLNSWCTAGWLAAVCAFSGGLLALTTFAIGLLNDLGVAELVALALASAAITIAGLIHCLISDSRTAWRRGFRLGFRLGLLAQQEGMQADGTAMSTGPSQLSVHNTPPTARGGSRG